MSKMQQHQMWQGWSTHCSTGQQNCSGCGVTVTIIVTELVAGHCRAGFKGTRRSCSRCSVACIKAVGKVGLPTSSHNVI